MKKTKHCNILVVGDLMLDKYIIGEVNRISPEAPVPILKVSEEYSTLGGAGNVINNLRSINVNVSCISRVGVDIAGATIISHLEKLEVKQYLDHDPDVQTTQKERIVANHRMTQLVRVDRECETPLEIRNIPINFNNKLLFENFDMIIVSDYAKGVITKELMDELKKLEKPILVDPKPCNSKLYDDVYFITPNKKEYDEMNATYFPKNINVIVETLGKDGMDVIYSEVKPNGETLIKAEKIESTSVNVYNVSGAGDTVVAILSTCISMGLSIIDSAKIANECARYVVQLPGTATVPIHIFDCIVNDICEFNKWE